MASVTTVIGSPFYRMERIDGYVPGRDLPPELSLTRDQATTLSTDVVGAGLQWLYAGQGYFGRQLRRWCERYRSMPTHNDARGRVESRLPRHSSRQREFLYDVKDFGLGQLNRTCDLLVRKRQRDGRGRLGR